MLAGGGGLALACGSGVELLEGLGDGTAGFKTGAVGLGADAAVDLGTGAAVGFGTGATGVCTGAMPVHTMSALQ